MNQKQFSGAERVAAYAYVRRHTLNTVCSDVALFLTVVSILLLLLVSSLLLEKFSISYLTMGGSLASKVHPATATASAALFFRCAAHRRPFACAVRLLTSDSGVVLLLAATFLLGVFAVQVSHTPVTPLIDTFVLPVLLFILLRNLDPSLLRLLALCVALVFCANAVLGIFEFASGRHVISIDISEGLSADPTRGNVIFDWRAALASDWRATSLFGHPLVNGLVVGAFIICLVAPASHWIPRAARLSLLLLQVVSMFAFGARASFVLSIVFSGYLIGRRAVEERRRLASMSPRQFLIALILLAALGFGALVLFENGFMDRTWDRFFNDQGSAYTRLTMFELFEQLSWDAIVLGPDADVVATWQRIYGLEFGIESSWLGLILTYGLIMTGIIVVGLAAFARSLTNAAGSGTAFVLVFFFLSVSASASLSGKTTVMAIIVVLIMTFLRKEDTVGDIRVRLQ